MGPLNLIKMGILGSNVGFLDINPKYVSHLNFWGTGEIFYRNQLEMDTIPYNIGVAIVEDTVFFWG